jgi:hypothetical protein
MRPVSVAFPPKGVQRGLTTVYALRPQTTQTVQRSDFHIALSELVTVCVALPTERITQVGSGIVRLTTDASEPLLAMHTLLLDRRGTLVPVIAMVGGSIALAAIATELLFGITAYLGTASAASDTLRAMLCVGIIVLAGAWGLQGI